MTLWLTHQGADGEDGGISGEGDGGGPHHDKRLMLLVAL